jgi:hypothetical protein
MRNHPLFVETDVGSWRDESVLLRRIVETADLLGRARSGEFVRAAERREPLGLAPRKVERLSESKPGEVLGPVSTVSLEHLQERER